MAVLTRRTRIVNFRLSENEYDDLITLCRTRGARSISDYARAAICHEIETQGSQQDGKRDGAVKRLDDKVAELDREVKRLKELIVMALDLDRGRTFDGRASQAEG